MGDPGTTVLTGGRPLPAILVADDDPVQRELVRATLEGGDYRVLLVTDGEDAVRTALAESPLLVFLDVQMPRLGGVDACRRLRAAGFRGTIVMLTAQARESDVQAGLAGGADDYLTKPFSPLQVMELAEEIVAAHRPGR